MALKLYRANWAVFAQIFLNPFGLGKFGTAFFYSFFFEDFFLTFMVFDANHSGLAEFFVEGIGDELLTPVGYFNYLLAVKKSHFSEECKISSII